jgi:acyl-CoA synthetase (AMP-forming)/AMP-acid ligase II
MSGISRTEVPAPGQAPMPAPNAAALLRRNGSDPDIAGRPAIRFEDRVWTHAEYVAESRRWANLFLRYRRPGAPFHIGVLLDNVPEYLFAFGGAALSGATVVGINHTRRGPHLLHDFTHTDCLLLVSEPRHAELIDSIEGAPLLMVGDGLEAELAAAGTDDPGLEPDPSTLWALIFTSGTSDAPKAVICSQRRLLVTGNRMRMLMGIGPDDVGYLCMPLFHSNAVMVGWAPSVIAGASVGLARRFSASRWLDDVRHYGATYFGYTGKPLTYIMATPERPDDADNPMRVAFGNEGSPQVVAGFGRRFGVEVVDTFGATEGGVAVNRVDGCPPTALGLAGAGVKVVDDEGNELPRARFDADGGLVDAEACVGEIVNTTGVGPFEGYYDNREANERTTRFGWYWTGDLGYVDEAGFLYFAGRNADWIRVDGENFPSGPIEQAIARHPAVLLCAVYGVPDVQAGDPDEFAAWLDAQGDIGPKWRPRYVRIASAMPTSPSNKILKRTLVHEKYRPDRTGGDIVWVRDRGEASFRVFAGPDADALRGELAASGRSRFWDL